jgi:serine protease AprX
MPNQTLGQEIVDALLLSSPDGRRFLQNSPILPDVWLHFAAEPDARLDLLITPHSSCPAGTVAVELAEAMPRDANKREIAYLRGFVVAKLDYEELITHVLPRTGWWRAIQRSAFEDWSPPEAEQGGRRKRAVKVYEPGDPAVIAPKLEELVLAHLRFVARGAAEISAATGAQDSPPMQSARDTLAECSRGVSETIIRLARFLALIGTVAATAGGAGWAAEAAAQARPGTSPLAELLDAHAEAIAADAVARFRHLVESAAGLAAEAEREGHEPVLIFNVSHNRRAATALEKSIQAIKGDAARALFNISAATIGWAVLDTGIDGTHEAFLDHDARRPEDRTKSRVVESYDFTRVRELLRVEYLFDEELRNTAAEAIAERTNRKTAEIAETLLRLAMAAKRGAQVDWARVAPLIKLDPKTPPAHPHGTHVAGIIGADWRTKDGKRKMIGVCPDIRLYDLRVIAGNAEETEFAVIAALQYVRAANENYMRIHGVNMSLSIPHNVRNYACGRTPICDESEDLIDSGVVVVAAAGNRGYQQFQLASGGVFESYSSSSITDPGNADGVITVGATHRYWPHTYGVSFFSSRGPTGDGRMKPDIVAPGEKIESTVPNNGAEAMDGTSMAAPHVSGAAALLLARYSELIRQPALVKEILCRNATDLQRERSFQGNGMLDVLRALQDR